MLLLLGYIQTLNNIIIMQTEKTNQKDDQRKQSDRDVSGHSKNLNTKNDSSAKKDTSKTHSKSSTTQKDR